ncbi:MAG: ABC transporter substrate-binding protein [Microbacterium sp. 69-10]|uniref:ABC transporter substrate-binding protein n=1 Tax=Microbacterium sp. 69-10 TaxID=1895783 RepID=UPI0009622D85|nr:ABC transporter substrate-binding protein [Microbacterium sp. 69-10]OJU40703.1 MAG: ABC transporter substrate-binding protein [Microbacterium sp. 69-10]
MNKRLIGGIAAGVAALLVLTGCAGGDQPAAHDDTLKIGTMSKPTSLDPIDAIGGTMPYFQAVYDTLIRRAPDGTYEPSLATEWSYNDNRTVLTLTLRDDVTFDDGTKLDAAAVKANMDRFRDGGGPNASFLAGAEIAVVDPTHVTVTLPQADPGLEFYLSDSAGLMANPAKFSTDDALVTTPDGTGPYTLDSGKTAIGTSWVFDRRATYWGSKLDFSTITISAFDNENAMVNGLKTGQLDSALLQTADQQLAAENDPKLKAQDVLFDFQGVLLFDRGGALTPALAKPEVRQALNYAVDRETMLKVIRDGRGEITSQVWGVDTQGYEKSLDDYYAYDPAKAKELLADAGYADGFELVLPRLTTIVTDNIATALQTDLAAVGVTLTWQDVDAATALKQIFVQREFSGMVMNMGQSSDDWIVYKGLIAPGTFNFFGTTDETVQKLAASARTASGDEAKKIYQQLNEHIVKDAWFLPFYRMTYKLVTVPGITAVTQAGQAETSIYNYSLSH